MKENIKLALLGLIAVTLIINTFMKSDGTSSSATENSFVKPVSSAVVATPSRDASITPNAPIVKAGPKTLITFNEYDYDFGDLDQNTQNEKVFTFTNTGKEPLIITNAKGSCGCTVPEYPKEPIAPGY